jgi:hypothetical protein
MSTKTIQFGLEARSMPYLSPALSAALPYLAFDSIIIRD